MSMRSTFGQTVIRDYNLRRRRSDGLLHKAALSAAGGQVLASRELGHPLYKDLEVGEQTTAPMVSVFLDLSEFTRRTFWDDTLETVDLAQAVLTGFIQFVTLWGGHPLGLRGDGLYAGFSPPTGGDPAYAAAHALGACATSLFGVETEVNNWLKRQGREPVQARAGVDLGEITFIRTGTPESSEVNMLGFTANFAAKAEKTANAWEVVVGQGVYDVMPPNSSLVPHPKSPRVFTRVGRATQSYRFYDYRWRPQARYLDNANQELDGTPTWALVTK